ncbi:hypothetical protein, partial [Rhizobium leguminosarum]|uniref:hypothetical protein n=1 Tax=Rhizobium leguminosarum TaxID=384 RepID=UPI003F957117
GGGGEGGGEGEVVEGKGRMVGVLTIYDVVDVIHEEADEDIKRLGGKATNSVCMRRPAELSG